MCDRSKRVGRRAALVSRWSSPAGSWHRCRRRRHRPRHRWAREHKPSRSRCSSATGFPPTTGPQPPANGAMAYDRQRITRRSCSMPGHPSQTWVFDGGTRRWSQRFPAAQPRPRDRERGVRITRAASSCSARNADASTCDPEGDGRDVEVGRNAPGRDLHPANAPSECAALGSLAMASYSQRVGRRDLGDHASRVGTAAVTWRWHTAPLDPEAPRTVRWTRRL